MSKQSKINQKGMSLLAVQGLDWCMRKAFLWFAVIMGTIFLNVFINTLPINQVTVFLYIFQGVYLGLFTLRAVFNYKSGSDSWVFTSLASIMEMIGLCILLMKPIQVTDTSMTLIFELVLVSLALYFVGTKLSTSLFKRYLFNNVIDVEYLGLKKSTETSLYNEHSLINDIELTSHDTNAQMTMINKNAIKPEYRSIVEVTNMEYEKVISPRYYREGTALGKPQGNIKHTFEMEDMLYHLHFNFHLFGINSRFSPSYLPLIDLTVSENNAK
ncbi:hypothetical protein PNU50_07815 [Streptococcus salivarius]|uniref:hypothetical protein n=1 Tax=Streptococcus salivarius TaxID=1304 RepID=UPI00232AFE77|nr:hypothetical protein [Streptococcus salivarius]MDB8610308.1 hypothetical protein [Streptococcus salivarius]